MSWSVAALGKAPAVAAKLKADFSRINCVEPEQEIKSKIEEAISVALFAYPPSAVVRVEANGSQWVPDSNSPQQAVNVVNLKIESIGGFVE